MLIAPYYRDFDLPWEGDPESSARFRKILRVLLIILVVLGIAFPLLPTPKRETPEEVPQRLARVMLENKPKPPPPPPPVPKEEKPKIEPKIAMVKPPPIDERERARRKAQKQLNQVKDELADLRDVMDLTPLETKNLSGSVNADAHAERSLDRKSTRLNSSHLVISYAVFCLKKKKKSRNYLLSNDENKSTRRT